MDPRICFWIVKDIPITGSLIRFWRSNRRPTCHGTGEQANQFCRACRKTGTAGARSVQASSRTHELRDNHHTIHRTIHRNTKFDSRHRSQLRSQRIGLQHGCCMASLCHYRCIRVRFGKTGSCAMPPWMRVRRTIPERDHTIVRIAVLPQECDCLLSRILSAPPAALTVRH